MTTDQKGVIAETAILHAAEKLHVDVYGPVNPGGRYDLLFDLGERFLRVQCKTAPLKGDVVVVRCYSSRRSAGGFLHRPYTIDEIDVIAAYCPDLNRCYVVPFNRVARRSSICLRVRPAKNNQHKGVLWARDYEFERLHSLCSGP